MIIAGPVRLAKNVEAKHACVGSRASKMASSPSSGDVAEDTVDCGPAGGKVSSLKDMENSNSKAARVASQKSKSSPSIPMFQR